MKNITEYTLDELNARIGQKVIYRGAWGHDEPEPAIFEGAEFDDCKHDIVVDVACEDGHGHWGYVYQITFVE